MTSTSASRIKVFAGLLACVLVAAGMMWAFGPRVGPPSSLTPTSFSTLGPGGEPTVLMVRFAWPEPGFCPGEFSVSASETGGVVTVSQVTRAASPLFGGSCAGLGTVDQQASVAVTLTEPVGTRRVVRAVDGQELRQS